MSAEMSFWDHLGELRKRILRSALGVGIGFGVAYYFSEEAFNFLMQPLCLAFRNPECSLQALSLMEAFLVYLKTGIIGGIFIAAPWIFYQLWAFVKPALRENERKYVVPFVLLASVMFVGGASFSYWIIFPVAFEFFIGTAGSQVVLQPSMDAYFNLAATMLIGLGLLFELPLIVVLFHALGLFSAQKLWATWRYAMVIIFVISALFPTTDPLTLFLLAGPLCVLYTVTLVYCSIREKLGGKKFAAA